MRTGKRVTYRKTKFPGVKNGKKIKDGISVEPQLRKLTGDQKFDEGHNDEKAAWVSF